MVPNTYLRQMLLEMINMSQIQYNDAKPLIFQNDACETPATSPAHSLPPLLWTLSGLPRSVWFV